MNSFKPGISEHVVRTKNPPSGAVSSTQALQWHKKSLREKLNFVLQGHKHNQYIYSACAHAGSKKIDTKQNTEERKWNSDVNTKSNVNL